MNCLDFRRAALADPRRPGAEAAMHAGKCAACREFLARALEFEDNLAAALRIEPPADLPGRLLRRTRPARTAWRWLALAASLLLAAALGFLLGTPRTDPLALAAIDFVVFDEAHAIAVAKPPEMRVLVDVSRRMRVSLPDQLGEIRYICVYPFAGDGAHHLLVTTPLGKVTLLLMPERALPARTAANARGLRAAIVPAAGGSVAIIGESSRSIRRVETLLRSG
jgi:hypothetical protein